MSRFLTVRNGRPVEAGAIPVLAIAEFRDEIIAACRAGGRLVALFGRPVTESDVRLYAVVSGGKAEGLGVISADVCESYPALTPECTQAHWFEREIAEQCGVTPAGHPWLKPVRNAEHRTQNAERRSNEDGQQHGHDETGRDGARPSNCEFYRVEGEEVHEVAVGPVHAGIIEPGHFRFQCHGENVFHLEISLGYQHRGVERAMRGGPDKRSLHYMETLAGDTSVGHALAYGQAVEGLSGCVPPARAQALRGIALELERMANHVGDLGALAGDVGYLPTASYCGRLRGDVLNLTALACGNRFGRGWVRPGGVGYDFDGDRGAQLAQRLEAAYRDIEGAVDMLWSTSSVMARFEETGPVSPEDCQALGLVGPAARACGSPRDVRFEFPTGIYRFAHVPVSVWHEGDVFARAYVRWLEIQQSKRFILDQVRSLPGGAIASPMGALKPNAAVVSLTEGWRGEICHVAITDEAGRFAAYKVIDPSFHNWMGLALALRNQQISDFPLCNKSFNLSYCGHDL